jgi:hypothetical protein
MAQMAQCKSAAKCGSIKPTVSVFKYKLDALFKEIPHDAQLDVEQTSSSKALPTMTKSKLPKPINLHDKPTSFAQKGSATNTCAPTSTSGDAPWWKVKPLKPLPHADLFISLFNVMGVGNPKVSLKLSVFGSCDKQKLNSLDLGHKLKELLNAYALKPACWVKPKPLLV